MEDPAVTATAQLNAILARLEVPFTVQYTKEAGKHVCATRSIGNEEELLEEAPLVSWPSPSLLQTAAQDQPWRVQYCFACLRCSWPEKDPHTTEEVTTLPAGWRTASSPCSCGAVFCSSDCLEGYKERHSLLCRSLSSLRVLLPPSTAEEMDRKEAATATLPPSSVKRCCVGEDSVITLEALARCVVHIVTRLGMTIQRSHLSSSLLKEAFDESPGENAGPLLTQLFQQVTAPFNRLISTPDDVHFSGIDFREWVQRLGASLYSPCRSHLERCARGRVEEEEEEEEEEEKDVVPLPPVAASWEDQLLLALFRKETLSTLLGLLVLNAHAVNDFALCFAARSHLSKSNDNAKDKEEGDDGKGSSSSLWIKGAAVYSILSAFNHSCEPNVAVHHTSGTHDMVLRASRGITEGEEMCLTYIPLDSNATLTERQNQLNNYFFECRCPRCVREKVKR